MKNKAAISIFILLVIALHALPAVSYQGVRQTRWPFLAWAMYAKSYPPGPIEVIDRRVFALSVDGKRREVTPWLVGLSGPAFRDAYLLPLENGDSATARRLVNVVGRYDRDSTAQLRLETTQYRLVDTGVVVDRAPAVTFPTVPQR
jgi:hypothetical protein